MHRSWPLFKSHGILIPSSFGHHWKHGPAWSSRTSGRGVENGDRGVFTRSVSCHLLRGTALKHVHLLACGVSDNSGRHSFHGEWHNYWPPSENFRRRLYSAIQTSQSGLPRHVTVEGLQQDGCSSDYANCGFRYQGLLQPSEPLALSDPRHFPSFSAPVPWPASLRHTNTRCRYISMLADLAM